MKYFITGGAGFIGREVTRQLLKENHTVTIYDDFSFGRDENIAEFRANNSLKVVKGRIQDHDHLLNSMKDLQPDCIIHLAALHFIPFCNSHPLETIQANVEGTYSVFEAASKLQVKRVLFASSGVLYQSEEKPLEETGDPPTPTDVYGCSKFIGEQLCEYFSRKPDGQYIIMRFFNTYGLYETNEHLIPEIMKQLHNGNRLKLGNIKTKRDYIFTEDIARAIILLSQSNRISKKLELVNIGSGKEFSAEEIVNKIALLMRQDINIDVDAQRIRPSDKMHQTASLEHIKELINWNPEHSLEDGLTKLLKFEKLI